MGYFLLLRVRVLNVLTTWVELVLRFFPVAIGVWAVVTIILGAGMMHLSSDDEIEAAVDSYDKTSFKAKEHFENAFPDASCLQLIYLISRHGTIFTLDAYTEIQAFDRRFRSEIETDGLYFKDLCYHLNPELPCLEINHPLSFWAKAYGVYDVSGVESEEELLAQINSGRNIGGNVVNTYQMFGKPKPEVYLNPDFSNNITQSSGVFYLVAMTGDDDLEDEVKDFEVEIEDFLDEFNDDALYIKASAITFQGVPRSSSKMIQENVGILVVAGLPLMFVAFAIGFIRLTCKTLVFEHAIGALLTIASSLCQGIGLAAWAGAKDTFSSAVVVPFLLFVVTLSHSFFILSAFNRTEGSPIVRVQETYRTVGIPLLSVSILHTLAWAYLSIWNIVRLNNVTAVFAVVYACLIFNWLLLTPVLLYFSAWRQSRNLGDFGCCLLSHQAPVDKPVEDIDTQEQTQPAEPVKITSYYDKALTLCYKVQVQLVVSVLLLAFIGVSVGYASTYSYRVTPLWFTVDGSSIHTGLETREDHFKRNGFGLSFTCRNLALSETSQQLDLVELADAIETCKDCDDDWFVAHSLTSWYTYYRGWISTGACQAEGKTVTLNSQGVIDSEFFVPCLKVFLATAGLGFNPNIQFNDDATEVTAVYITANMHFLDDDEVKTGMGDLMDVIDRGPGDCTPYNPILIFYDHYVNYVSRTVLHFMMVFNTIALCSLASTFSLVRSLVVALFCCFTAFAMLGVAEYSDDIQTNAIVETLTVFAFATSADLYLYYFAFLSALPSTKDRKFLAFKQFMWPAFGKLLIIIAASCGLAAAPKMNEYVVIALLYGFVNFFQSVFTLPLVLRIKMYKKKVYEVDESAATTKRTNENELELSVRLKDDTTIVQGEGADQQMPSKQQPS